MTSISLALAASLGLSEPVADDPQCTIIRYAPDGLRTQTVGDPSPYGVSISGGQASLVGGAVVSSSIVAASSSASGEGRAVSTSRVRDGDRTITLHTNRAGCTVTIDERPAPRRDP